MKYSYLLLILLFIAPTVFADAPDYSFKKESCDCYSDLELYDTTRQGSLLGCDYKGPDNVDGYTYPKINVDTWAYYNDSQFEKARARNQKDYDRFSEKDYNKFEAFYIEEDRTSLIYYVLRSEDVEPKRTGNLVHTYRGHKISIWGTDIPWNPKEDFDKIDSCMMKAVDEFIINEEKKLMGPGIHERDGKLYINSTPGEVLDIQRYDLSVWARAELVTIGAMVAVQCPADIVAFGDLEVLFEGLPVARKGDKTVQGGTIIEGSENIFINGIPAAFVGGFVVSPAMVGPIPCVGGPIVTNGGIGISLDGEVDEDSMIDYLKENSEDFRLTTEKVKKGSTIIEVDNEGIEIGDVVFIGNSYLKGEAVKVINKGSLIIDRPLQYTYSAGTLIT